MYCSQCGAKAGNDARFCGACGRDLTKQDVPGQPAASDGPGRIGFVATATTDVQAVGAPSGVVIPSTERPLFTSPASQRVSDRTTSLPFFPVATHKFLILSICSFSIYELYWCYKNWQRIQDATGESIDPFWRAFFAPLWVFSLFGRVRERAVGNGIAVQWSAGVLGTFYLVLSVLWRLPDPWWLISFATVVPMLPVQQTAQRVNDRVSSSESRNGDYSTANVATIVIGGLFLVLAVIGTFLPE